MALPGQGMSEQRVRGERTFRIVLRRLFHTWKLPENRLEDSDYRYMFMSHQVKVIRFY